RPVVELNGTATDQLGVTFNTQSGTLTGAWDPTKGLTADYNPMQQQISQLTAHIDALVRDNKARLLASPSIVAMDSKTSTIQITDDIVQKIEFTTTSNTTATITNQNITLGTAGITLSITPKINPDGYISMELKPEISFVRQTVPGQAAGSILATLKSTRSLDTPEVRVRNGETLIIGGLDQDQVQDNVDKIPVLGDLPLLGPIFRQTVHSKVTTELVMMVTPHVVPEGEHLPPGPAIHS
ncbi:MAG TPA: type II and III secretion system protein, partial [Oscillatoriaceae cyanobacterium]